MRFFERMGGLASALLLVSSMHCTTAIVSAKQATEGLCINEVCTQNKECFTDSLGRASDWIELFNGSSND
ncbi:MAG: hypothetical protein IIZ53_01615, partial [Ruminococcus sp.]|nr:hypothetical protein [Ruminococcus sp.]